MKTVPLSDWVGELESGARPKGGIKDGIGEVPSLGAEHLADDGGFNFAKDKRIPYDFYRSMKKGRIQTGDILIVKDGATTGKVSFVNGEFPYEEAAINEHVFRLGVSRKKADPRFVFRYLQSPFGQQQIISDFRGATVGGIGRTFLDKVFLPDLAVTEQHRIASILDKADAVCRKRRQSLALADDFIRAVFLEKFGDPIVNAKGLPRQPLGKFGKIVTGNTPPRSDPGNFGDAVEWIKSDNVNTEEHFLTHAVEGLSVKGKELGRIVPKDSILVTCIAGSPASIGRAAIADRSVAFNQQINAITPFKDVNLYFLYAQFLIGKALVLRSSTNSMKGMISKGEFQKIEFLRPEPSEQAKFGKVFEKQIEASRLLREASIQAAELFSTLSQRAFRGEL
jgi:type I restriction enzyme S subunit